MAFQVNRSLRRGAQADRAGGDRSRGDCVDQCRRTVARKQPVAAAARAVRVPVPQSFELSNGLSGIRCHKPVVCRWYPRISSSEAAATQSAREARARELHRPMCSIGAPRPATPCSSPRKSRRSVRRSTRILHAMRPRCRRAASAGIFLRRLRSSPTSRFARVFRC